MRPPVPYRGRPRISHGIGAAAALLLLLAFASGCSDSNEARDSGAPRQALSDETPAGAETGVGADDAFRAFSAEIMATRIEVLLPSGDAAAADAEAVFDVFRAVDAEMSEWKESSPLSAVNRAAGREWVRVPPDLFALLRRGVEIGRMTGGAFDVTWAALWGLWDFKSPRPEVPPAAEIARRVNLVDYRQLSFSRDGTSVKLQREGMLVGLGGIAKGYALDGAAAVLRERGVRDFLISGGGQIYAAGSRGGEAWRLGLRDPRGEADDFFAQLEVRDLSASTSGDYERFFVADGVRYHHVLDPRTGMPARGLRSATVLSADATLADALSTAIMVMGRERGLALVDSLQGVEAVLVDQGGEVHATEGAARGLVLRHDPRPE